MTHYHQPSGAEPEERRDNMNAPININASRLQSMLVVFLRERGKATASELHDDLRKAGITVTERRVTTNLASLSKKRKAERLPCKWGRLPTEYFPVYESSDTTDDDLATAVCAAVDELAYPAPAEDILKTMAIQHRRFAVIPMSRLHTTLFKLVDESELATREEDDTTTFRRSPARAPERVQMTEELVRYVRVVVPLVCDRRRKHGAAKHVKSNGFPRLFSVRGEADGRPQAMAELRWRQRAESGSWRLVRARFQPWNKTRWNFDSLTAEQVDVTVGDWQDEPPAFD